MKPKRGTACPNSALPPSQGLHVMSVSLTEVSYACTALMEAIAKSFSAHVWKSAICATPREERPTSILAYA